MLVAAVKAGADAIYFGLQEFSMRANANNFKVSELEKMREVCNQSPRRTKLYLTLNTIIYEEELKKLENLIKKVKGKVDAIICWDHSVIMYCKKYKIPFFISTQASISNTIEAKFYKKIGAKRVVLARELNLKQIKEITKIIEVETFAHGAMCVAVSGRCFMSQFTHNKSANRGECLQNCRRSYVIKDDSNKELRIENSRVMSAKDLCSLPFIEEMKKAGIKSFKIEGRGRDPRYVSYVTKSYRKALDKKLSKAEIIQEMNELKKVFNRDFSSGFFLGKPAKKDFSKVEHNNATEKKEFVGKVIHYFPKAEVATIKLSADIKVGDKIAVIGKTTGIEEFVIKSMEIENKKVKIAKKGGEVGIKIPKIRKNDELYKIIKSK